MKTWRSLLETAIQVPSPHNVQPWRVRINSETQADLLIEKQRTLPKEDVTGSFIILTMGLFIEGLRILAANRSYNLSYQFLQTLTQFTPQAIESNQGFLLPFAQLTLEPGTEQSSFPDSLFLVRRTSRISYLPKPIPNESTEALANLARDWNQRYEAISDKTVIEKLLEWNTEALFEDLNSPEYHDEIVEWFRFTSHAARKSRDGLDYRCMNASRLSFWSVARFPRLLQFRVVRPILKRIYRRQLGKVPTIGLLAGPFWEPESAFETGRFLMHFWLELAKHNLYIHPYGNLVTNSSAAQLCLKELGIPDIWLIFKIGFSNKPPKSYRRSVEEVLVD